MVSEVLAAVEMRLATYQHGRSGQLYESSKLFCKRRRCQSMLRVAFLRIDCSEADPTLRDSSWLVRFAIVRMLSGG